jgi:hypothetical protein
MTMLMHTSNPLGRAASRRRDAVSMGVAQAHAQAHLAVIKRLGVGALAVLAAGGALAAIIALKAALFVWVFHYY